MSRLETSANIEYHIRVLRPLINELSLKKAVIIVDDYCRDNNLNQVLIKRILDLPWKVRQIPAKEIKPKSISKSETDCTKPRIKDLFESKKERLKFYVNLYKDRSLYESYNSCKGKEDKYKWIQAHINAIATEKTSKIKRYKNYLVSDQGHVYNNTGAKKRLVKPRKHRDGRLFVVLWKNNKRKCFYLHRLVAEYHIQNPNNYPDVLFKNGNKTDCRAGNLYWTKQPVNIPTWSIETPAKGETCVFCNKLTEEKVIAIYISASPWNQLAKEYNISRSFVSLIKNGKRWKWLTKNLISEKIAV